MKKKTLLEKENNAEDKDNCNKYVITKKYIAVDELEDDNPIKALFDSKKMLNKMKVKDE